MLRVWLAGLTLACALSGAGRAAAQDVAPPQGPYVVIVGVGTFADPAIQARPTAEADARAMYDLFADPQYSLAAPGRVVLLTGTPDEKRKSQPATREGVVKALHEAVAKTGKDDTLVVALFGRGASAVDQTCLFTSETKFAERAKTGLVGADLAAELKPAKERKLLVMLDIAFKGFDPGKEVLAEPNLRDITTAVFGGEDKGEDQPPTQDKVLILASTPAASPVSVGGNGLFAKTAIDALKGVADTDGYEPDGLVVIDELAKYLEKTVQEQVRTLGKTQQEKEAVPLVIGEETAHFPVTKNPKLTAKVAERQKALAALAAAKAVNAEAAAEGKELLGRMPKLKAMQELRKKYQDLTDGTLKPAEFAAARDLVREGMRLPASDADRYARTVLKAIDAVRGDYVKAIEPGEWANFAVKGLYRRLETAVPDDVKAKLQDAKGLKREEIAEVLRDVRTRFGKREDLDDDKDADTTITMMFAELRDPYTSYYDAATLKKMEAPLRGEFRGVGIQIRRDLVRDGLLVVSPIKNSPAYKAGIQAGDLITAIKRDVDPKGKPLPEGAPRELSTKGMKTEQALDVILGNVGVPVTIVVERDGETKEFTMNRGIVTTETVLGVKRDAKDEWDYTVDAENKIAYVCLTQFAPSSSRDLLTAIAKMKKAGLRGLVLDLRFNPGGLLDQARDISDLFIEDGLIVTIRYRSRPEESLTDRGLGRFIDFPMAVLVNGQSASASEIVSACLQDNGRAVVVGERSYGKGSVQTIRRFAPTGGEIKMTTARYFPPSGRNIDKQSTPGKPEDEWGVKPDKGYEVKLTREELQDLAEHYREHEVIRPAGYVPKEKAKPFTDKQLEKALEYLRGQVKAGGAKPAKGSG